MIDYPTLMMCSRLLPLWGYIDHKVLGEALSNIHATHHPNQPSEEVRWTVTTAGMFISDCGVSVGVSRVMRELGAARN